MSTLPDATEIIKQATPPGFPNVLVIGHGARQVTVYSQQIRALNLIWLSTHSGRSRGTT
jgi:hypothetical protein